MLPLQLVFILDKYALYFHFLVHHITWNRWSQTCDASMAIDAH